MQGRDKASFKIASVPFPFPFFPLFNVTSLLPPSLYPSLLLSSSSYSLSFFRFIVKRKLKMHSFYTFQKQEGHKFDICEGLRNIKTKCLYCLFANINHTFLL